MRQLTLIAAIAAMLALPAPTFAQDSVGDGYGGAGGVAGEVAVGGQPDQPAAPAAGDVLGESAGDDGSAGGEAGVSGGGGGGGEGPVATASGRQPLSGDSLPFTGMDVALMLAGGLALLFTGAAMRRLSRSQI